MNLTFASSKGGVGKSTTCACIGALLARRGEPTLIFDLDQNGTLHRWSARTDIPGLTIRAVSDRELKSAYNEAVASDAYEHILIDLAGVDQTVNLKAVSVANLVVIPAHISEPDVFEAAKMVDQIDTVSETAGRKIEYRILFTMVRPLGPTNADKFILDQVREAGHQRFATMLALRNVYKELFLNGVPPFEAEPKSGAGPELNALMSEIELILADTAILEAGE